VKAAVLVTQRLPGSALSRLETACDVDVHAERERLSSDALRQRLSGKRGMVCLVTDTIDRGVIDAAVDLEVIANVAVGFDNIDVAHAQSRGIVVTHTPDVLTEAVAEFTWGLILSLTRRIAEGDRLTRSGRWTGWALDFMLGMELRGKRLGIIGPGRIGRAVAARAGVFGMNVVATGHSARAAKQTTTDSVPDDIRQMTLDELLVTSDVVSLHVPMSDGTRHLINRQTLTRMKRTAFLVNASRGSVVDEAALVWALDERLIAGAALDVFEREPAVHEGLLAFDTVVLAPHLGSATRETRTAMAELAVANVVAVVSGEEPLTPVTL
jgi:glyoxylate reductase